MKMSLQQIRITGQNKTYWLRELQIFADRFDNTDTTRIEFGRQDSRGGISISFFGENGCINNQHFCESKDLMLGFVNGVNISHEDYSFIAKHLGAK